MKIREYLAAAECGQIPINSHDQLIRVAFARLLRNSDVSFCGEKLHANGWSFGHGTLKFNRTLDLFYLVQVIAAITLAADDEEGSKPSTFDVDAVDQLYARHDEWLHQDAWKKYYSPSFLAHPSSARFYRLPDLQDLPDSNDSSYRGRSKGPGHHTKLPRWAYNVARTRERQSTLATPTIKGIALSTLLQTVLRLREECPSVQPYSKTQACFWLDYMGLEEPRRASGFTWGRHEFGMTVARGLYDMWAWEAYYTPKHWQGTTEQPVADIIVAPDLDGSNKHMMATAGWPDGGAGGEAIIRGWEPELGSEEEIAFLAAVAVKETENITDLSQLNYAIRSHLLLGIMHATFAADKQQAIKDVVHKATAAGRLDDDKAQEWIQEALALMDPYADRVSEWPNFREARGELLRKILEENGQLFGRWKPLLWCEDFIFELNRPVGH